MDKYSVYSEFDIDKHKKTFVNYLEVIILPSGKVEYAVPSHQEKLIAIAMNKYNCTRDGIMAKCPVEYYFDFITWLSMITKTIAVWDGRIEGTPNRFQRHKLQELKRNGLYKGTIPE